MTIKSMQIDPQENLDLKRLYDLANKMIEILELENKRLREEIKSLKE